MGLAVCCVPERQVFSVEWLDSVQRLLSVLPECESD